MKKPFFSRRVFFFGSIAMLILCVVFFLVPFMGRGARMAVQNMQNDVADWLPSDFRETKELGWFYEHFRGEAVVVLTWPGCSEDDPRYHETVESLHNEVEPPEDADIGDLAPEEKLVRRARREVGDKFGLHIGADYRLNWGGRNEKWLYGFGGQQYFITPDGKLYRWDGQSNIIASAGRWIQKVVTGSNSATGDLVAEFPPEEGKASIFYQDPRKLTARLLKSVTTGPEILNQLAGENGTLRVGSDPASIRQARELAFDRLTGVLFGPEVLPAFQWQAENLSHVLPDKRFKEVVAQNPNWKETVQEFIRQLVNSEYDGDIQKLRDAPDTQQGEHWRDMFERLGMEPPARQTCIMLSFSNVGLRNFSLCVGREMLGKPKGMLRRVANESGVSDQELKMGGPPVDNVAIDEEGKITLFRLVFYSAIVGMTLAMFCFRSFKVTLMVFFVGGVGAAMSLSIVWWSGTVTDAIVMSMPALVYVLGLSGAVHIVNYYRDAVRERGLHAAPETALGHGWFPCTLAAFTTALGLMSLYIGSGVVPIKKFGLFSAIGVLATLILLFTYLPSALHVWNPGYHKRRKEGGGGKRPSFMRMADAFWRRLGVWVVRHHWLVTAGCVAIMITFALGLSQIKTSVHLLKLFHSEAKIIKDYTWMEKNLSYLVPMELLIAVDKDLQRPPLDELAELDPEERNISKENTQLNFLERVELTDRVHRYVEQAFGAEGEGIVGRGLSAPVFLPPLPGPNGSTGGGPRFAFNAALEDNRDRLLKENYLRVDHDDGRELWRISLRVSAMSDVDYGVFVNELKRVVEPVMAAYRYRNEVLRGLVDRTDGIRNSTVLVLGADPRTIDDKPLVQTISAQGKDVRIVNATRICAETLDELLRNKGFRGQRYDTKLLWHDPENQPLTAVPQERWAAVLEAADCVVLLRNHEDYDRQFIDQHAQFVVDAQDHSYDPQASNSQTATDLRIAGDPHTNITVAYTGIVPIVYKAQRTLLRSLINSIGLAFIMIAIVMMLLLRDWRRRTSLKNSLNFAGGLVSMLPNVFPVVVIFGAIGWTTILARNGIWLAGPKLVDIGTMMTASVAMGIAVDDTIHFLNWFRAGLREGLTRKEAIAQAYDRVGTAMTQTTLIGGFGLAVFYFSTFMPTQSFGLMMLLLLVTALVGDLIFLPALLAGPLGRFFEVAAFKELAASSDKPDAPTEEPGERAETPHSGAARSSKSAMQIRVDASHKGSE